MLAKRKFPLGEKEKRCINEYGKMIINRANYKRQLLAGHLAKAKYRESELLSDNHDCINTPQLNDSTAKTDILEEGAQQS